MHIRRRSAVVSLLVALGALIGSATALAAPAGSRTVSYHGYSLRVPSAWPVYRLGPRSTTCVRFDRHAVYLGVPGASQLCPPRPAGRTEAILVSPPGRAAMTADSLLPSTGTRAASSGRSAVRIIDRADHVDVTATWNRHPELIRRALRFGSPRGSRRSFTVARERAATLRPDAGRAPASPTVAATTAIAGGVYTGLGFDACSTPSIGTMSDWSASPFRAAGVYIGGTNMACSQANLTAGWVNQQSADGWHLIPIYVGLQAPSNSCGCSSISPASAAAEGTAAAADAVAKAQALGLGAGNPIYDDMEAYDRTAVSTGAVLSFLSAWTTRLHAAGYLSGVYSSDDSGIEDLVAHYGSGYAEPDELWSADWNDSQSTVDPAVPAADWADHQRLHQYRGGHTDRYGGATLDVDSDYLDAATAAAGSSTSTITTPEISATPSLTVAPQANGTIELAPSWAGETGVVSWQIEGGSSPSALTPLGRAVRFARTRPIVAGSAYAYYQVLALDSSGQTLGTSPTIPTPAHVAIYGHSAYVPRHGPGGVPVACFGGGPCRVIVKIADGTRILRRTAPQRIAAGGGVAHFKLSNVDHRLVAGASDHGLPVTVTVNGGAGGRTVRQLNLVPYTTNGPGPSRSSTPSATIKLVGLTEYVSKGWSGGVLAACIVSEPCQASTTITARGTVLATTPAESLGAGMVGYLHFTLTAAGHRLLERTKSNELAAHVQITTATTDATGGASAGSSASASGQIQLSSF